LTLSVIKTFLSFAAPHLLCVILCHLQGVASFSLLFVPKANADEGGTTWATCYSFIKYSVWRQVQSLLQNDSSTWCYL